MFYCISKKEFSAVLFYGAQFFSKKSVKTRFIFDFSFKKSMFYASKRFQMERFCRILMKSPINLHTGRFYKISKNFEFLTPKTPKSSIFIAFSRKKFLPNVLFYGPKTANFVLLGPPPKGQSRQ